MQNRFKIALLAAAAVLAGCGNQSEEVVGNQTDVSSDAGSSVSVALRNIGELGGEPWDNPMSMNGAAQYDYFGYAMVANDINHDGYADLITSVTNEKGNVQVFKGSADGISDKSVVLSHDESTYFGYALASGKFCDDSDVIVTSAIASKSGEIFILKYENDQLVISKRFVSEESTKHKWFGSQLAVGDWNGDGKADLAVMAATSKRRIYYYSDFCNIENDAVLSSDNVITADESGTALGDKMVFADLNGDGKNALIVTDSLAFPGENEAKQGAVYIYEDDGSGSLALSQTIKGDTNDQISSVAVADMDGDGDLDLIIGGAQRQTDAGFQAGHVGILLNDKGTFKEGSFAWKFSGDHSYGRLGSSVLAQDINGDGYMDLLVGANGFNEKQLGYTYLFMGTGMDSLLTSVPFWTYHSNAALNKNDLYGQNVVAVDMDGGKGWLDVAIAAPNAHVKLVDDEYVSEVGRIDIFVNSTSPCWTTNSCWIDNTACYENGSVKPNGGLTGDELCQSKIEVCDISTDFFSWTSSGGNNDGVICGEDQCKENGTELVSYSCASGACVAKTTSCGIYKCRDAACLTSCKSDEDCAYGACVAGVCISNQPPVADAGADIKVNVVAKVTLDGSKSSDPDGDNLTYKWEVVSSSNTISLINADTAKPSFTAPATADVITFRLTVSDGKATSSDEVVVTVVKPDNQAPVAKASADPVSVPYGGKVTLSGSNSYDPDAGPSALIYSWTCKSANNNKIELKGQAQEIATFIAPEADDTITCRLSVSDGEATSNSESLVITVYDNNNAPVAAAGDDVEIFVGEVVVLDGSKSSDQDGDELTYKWEITDGKGSLSDSTSAKPTFMADATPGSVTILLTVSDGKASATDELKITVKEKVNTPPTANAGSDVTAFYGDEVKLSGAGSKDPDGDNLTYKWEVVSSTAGNDITLTSTNKVQTSFVAPEVNDTITLKLTVDDGRGGTATDEVVVTVIEPNYAPVANAGADLKVYVSEPVQLDASASSDKNGDQLTYKWVQVSGGVEVELSDDTAEKPTFTAPDAPTEIVFELTVSDGKLTSTDSVTIVVVERPIPVNHAPVALFTALNENGEPFETVDWEDVIYFDASSSYDEDNDDLFFTWVVESGNAEMVCDDNSPYCQLTVPKDNSPIVVRLEVSDGKLTSSSTTTLVVNHTNRPPVADAGGDQQVDFGAFVTVPGTNSYDLDGDVLSYEWVVNDQVVSTDSSYTFTAGIVYEQISITLYVSDGIAESSDTVTITVGEPNLPPVVKFAENLVRGVAGETVELNASPSSDPDGDAISFTWTQVSGQSGILSDADSSIAHFTIPDSAQKDETFTFEVSVYDGQAYAKDTMTVYVYEATTQLDAPVIVEPAENATVSSKPAFNGTAATADGSVRVFEKDGAVQTNICSGKIQNDLTWKCDASFDLAAGNHAVYAVQIIEGTLDQSKTSDVRNFTVDAAQIEAPVILAPASGDEVAPSFIVSGQAGLNSGTITVEVLSETSLVVASCTDTTIENGVWACSTKVTVPGIYTLRAIHSVDDNSSPYSEEVNITVLSPLSQYSPAISGIVRDINEMPVQFYGTFAPGQDADVTSACKVSVYHDEKELCSQNLEQVLDGTFTWSCDVSYDFTEIESWVSAVVTCGSEKSSTSKEYRVIVDPYIEKPEDPSFGVKGGLCSAAPVAPARSGSAAPFILLTAAGIIVCRRRRTAKR